MPVRQLQVTEKSGRQWVAKKDVDDAGFQSWQSKLGNIYKGATFSEIGAAKPGVVSKHPLSQKPAGPAVPSAKPTGAPAAPEVVPPPDFKIDISTEPTLTDLNKAISDPTELPAEFRDQAEIANMESQGFTYIPGVAPGAPNPFLSKLTQEQIFTDPETGRIYALPGVEVPGLEQVRADAREPQVGKLYQSFLGREATPEEIEKFSQSSQEFANLPQLLADTRDQIYEAIGADSSEEAIINDGVSMVDGFSLSKDATKIIPYLNDWLQLKDFFNDFFGVTASRKQITEATGKVIEATEAFSSEDKFKAELAANNVSELEEEKFKIDEEIIRLREEEQLDILSLENQPVSTRVIGQKVGALQKQNYIKMNTLIALSNLYENRVTSAYDKAATAVNLAQNDFKNRLDAAKIALNAAGDLFTEQQKNAADGVKAMLGRMESQYDQAQGDRDNIVQAMLKYPQAGVSPTDTLEEAVIKMNQFLTSDANFTIKQFGKTLVRVNPDGSVHELFTAEEDEMLSVMDAARLGVPFGTTVTEAASMGKMPRFGESTGNQLGGDVELTKAQLTSSASNFLSANPRQTLEDFNVLSDSEKVKWYKTTGTEKTISADDAAKYDLPKGLTQEQFADLKFTDQAPDWYVQGIKSTRSITPEMIEKEWATDTTRVRGIIATGKEGSITQSMRKTGLEVDTLISDKDPKNDIIGVIQARGFDPKHSFFAEKLKNYNPPAKEKKKSFWDIFK